MTTRKAHPARNLRDLDRSQRTLDAQRNEHVNGASWDMSWDLSVNDGGARVRELAAASRSLCDQAEDIRSARLIVLLRRGDVRPQQDGSVFGATRSTVQTLCTKYPECAHEWAAQVKAMATTPC